MEKNEYIDKLLATAVINDNALAALVEFKNNFKPSRDDASTVLVGLQMLADKITAAYDVAPISVNFIPIAHVCGGASYYDSITRRVVLVGRISVITALHEIGHALFGASEDDARQFSYALYKAAYPRTWDKLKVIDGFYMVMA